MPAPITIRHPHLTDLVSAGVALHQRPEYAPGQERATIAQLSALHAQIPQTRLAIAARARRVFGFAALAPAASFGQFPAEPAARKMELRHFGLISPEATAPLGELAEPALAARLLRFVLEDHEPAQLWIPRDQYAAQRRSFWRGHAFTADGLTLEEAGQTYLRLVR